VELFIKIAKKKS